MINRVEREAGNVAEDSVVGDERDPKAQCGSGDPAVGVVLALGERMAGGLAVGSKLGVDEYELGAGVNDLGLMDLGVELELPRCAPAVTERAVA